MNKILISCILLLSLSATVLNAAAYKGQRVFVSECLPCHESIHIFVSSKDTTEWNTLMANSGKPLARLHVQSIAAKESWNYFKSTQYSKKSKHIKDFLLKHSKGSTNIIILN